MPSTAFSTAVSSTRRRRRRGVCRNSRLSARATMADDGVGQPSEASQIEDDGRPRCASAPRGTGPAARRPSSSVCTRNPCAGVAEHHLAARTPVQRASTVPPACAITSAWQRPTCRAGGGTACSGRRRRRFGRGQPGVDLGRGQRLLARPEQTRPDRPHRREADDQGRADRRGPRRDAGHHTGARARHRPSMPRRACGAAQHRPNGTLRRPRGRGRVPYRPRGGPGPGRRGRPDDPHRARARADRARARRRLRPDRAGRARARRRAPPGRRRARPRAARRRRHRGAADAPRRSARSRSSSPRPATTRPRSSRCSTRAPTTTSSSRSAPRSSTRGSAPSCAAGPARTPRTPRSWSAGCGSTRAPGRPASTAARWS